MQVLNCNFASLNVIWILMSVLEHASEAAQTVKVAAYEWAPFVYMTKRNGTFELSGPMKNLIDIIKDKLDLKYEFYQPYKGYWGSILPDGNWSGMIGMIERKEVKFAVGPFVMSQARREVVDYSAPIFTDSYLVVTERPRVTPNVYGFVWALDSYVYVAIVLSLLLMALFMRKVILVERKQFQSEARSFSYIDSLVWAGQILFQEGTAITLRASGSRILIATWLVSTLVFMKSYETMLTSMLAFPAIDIPINSLEDLAKQDELPWKLEQASWSFEYFKTSAKEIDRKIFKKRSGVFPDCYQSCDAIGRGEFVGICDRTTIMKCMHYDFSQNNRCNVYAAKHPVVTGANSGLVFQKNFTYLPAINKWISWLQEGGIVDKWMRDQLGNASFCITLAGPKNDELKYLRLENFIGCFYFLAIGLMMGLLAFLIEILSFKIKTSLKKFKK